MPESWWITLNCLCGIGDRWKCTKPYLQLGPLPEIFFFANRHTDSRIWTFAEPEFRLRWMKLCSSVNHDIMEPPVNFFPKIWPTCFRMLKWRKERDCEIVIGTKLPKWAQKLSFRHFHKIRSLDLSDFYLKLENREYSTVSPDIIV